MRWNFTQYRFYLSGREEYITGQGTVENPTTDYCSFLSKKSAICRWIGEIYVVQWFVSSVEYSKNVQNWIFSIIIQGSIQLIVKSLLVCP